MSAIGQSTCLAENNVSRLTGLLSTQSSMVFRVTFVAVFYLEIWF